MSANPLECPSCGGAGGGPVGRAGSAWDSEDYVCPRCQGAGVIAMPQARPTPVGRPGVIKGTAKEPEAAALPAAPKAGKKAAGN